MTKALWEAFPRLLVQNINRLLEGAHPNALRSFQIYSTIKNRGLWTGSLESYSNCLDSFFSQPKASRKKSLFDLYLNRPMEHDIYALFNLDFRSAVVADSQIESLASWAHNLIRVNKGSSAEISSVSSLDILTKTFKRITNPAPNEKAKNLEFSDFCLVWRKTVRAFIGDVPETEFSELIKELNWMSSLDQSSLQKEKVATVHQAELSLLPGLFLTQTQIDWVVAVRESVAGSTEAPKYPRSKETNQDPLKDLSRVVELYNKARLSKLPLIIKQRENIITTVFALCEDLIGSDEAPNKRVANF